MNAGAKRETLPLSLWPSIEKHRGGLRMTHHPKERYGGLNRRDFLLRSAVAASALSGAGGLLAACSSSTDPEQQGVTVVGSTGEV